MPACQYCSKEYKYIKGHEAKCKPYYDEAAKTTETPTADDVMAARKQARTRQLEQARAARTAMAVANRKRKARELLADDPEPEPVVEAAPAVVEIVPEPEPKSPEFIDWNSMY